MLLHRIRIALNKSLPKYAAAASNTHGISNSRRPSLITSSMITLTARGGTSTTKVPATAKNICAAASHGCRFNHGSTLRIVFMGRLTARNA